MMEKSLDEISISRLPLFEALPPEEIRYLAQTLSLVKASPETLLFLEGDPGDRFSIILEGQVEIIKALGSENEWVLAVLGPGEFIGEMSLLYRDRLRSASARTRTPVKVLEMKHTDFDALINRQPALALRIMQEMSLRVRNSENATIRDLEEKNRQLSRAYYELKVAQQQLVEKEKLEHELFMARKIQESILPDAVPDLPGWKLAAHWQPARAVSGDFYDFIPFPDGKIAIIVGDSSGKGVPAALLMATTRSVLRATSRKMASPGEILAEVNDLLCPDIPPNMFVTCFYAILDPATGVMRYANAGHDLPIQRVTGGILELKARGMPLGLLPGMVYEEKETLLSNGDCVVMYSDGLVEAHNIHKEMFGMARLRDLLASPPNDQSLISFLLDHLALFTGQGREQEDDVTFVVLDRERL